MLFTAYNLSGSICKNQKNLNYKYSAQKIEVECYFANRNNQVDLISVTKNNISYTGNQEYRYFKCRYNNNNWTLITDTNLIKFTLITNKFYSSQITSIHIFFSFQPCGCCGLRQHFYTHTHKMAESTRRQWWKRCRSRCHQQKTRWCRYQLRR